MQVDWRPDARRDLLEILDFISDRDQVAAENLYSRITSYTELIARFPEMHRLGRVDGAREAIIHPNYVLVYAIEDETVAILRLLHSRQNYP